MKTNRNYAQFYALLNKLPGATDGLKEELVLQYTGGRTESLRAMTDKEYRAMCASMREAQNGMDESAFTAELKRRRSAVLKRLQRMGVDTTSWANVDNFCLAPRIAGKRFAKLNMDELAALIPKLESILRKDKQQQKRVPIPAELLDMSKICWN